MKNYELTYLISSDLSEQEIKSLSLKVNDFIQQEEGAFEKTTKPSKVRLDRLMTSLNFSLDPKKLTSLEKKLKIEKDILRYIIIIKKKIKQIPSRARVLQPKTEKVELKEIDKKIEEILKE